MPDENFGKFTDNQEMKNEELNVDDVIEETPPDESAAAEEGASETEQKSEVDELKNQLALARADLYNYRQRTERDRVKNRKLIAEDKIAEFLPVLDNLDRALCVPEDSPTKDVLKGVRMVQVQFLSVLGNSGVTVIPTEGCTFDPMLHDAVETEPVEMQEQDGAILYELLRGYRTPDRVLRPSQVRVGRFKS